MGNTLSVSNSSVQINKKPSFNPFLNDYNDELEKQTE